MRKIELVDLKTQYLKIKPEIDQSIQEVLDTTTFINGPAVKRFKANLSAYLDGLEVIPCANGTDALQICMMALGLKPGDEVITPSFTFAATAEVIALLGLVPKFIDVDPDHFNLDATALEKVMGPKTKAIVPVHLFGQCADMEPINAFAKAHGLYVIEDLAQSIGAKYTFSDGRQAFTGALGHIGSTSFFPSKNLGAYGDGGAIFTTNQQLAEQSQMIANHGMSLHYYHDIIGVNSRLDSIQAAILDVKLRHLDSYNEARISTANKYDSLLKDISALKTPSRLKSSTHVFHQYTLTCLDGKRDELKKYLDEKMIPNKVYYPVPLHMQKAYNLNDYKKGDFPVSEKLSDTVISLPMHSELDDEQIGFITDSIKSFYK